MAARKDDEQAEDTGRARPETVVVPSDQAVPVPPVPDRPIQATPAHAPASDVPRRAQFKGEAGEYITPLLVAERDEETGAITERIYYTPGRDLTDDEWQAMPAAHREYVRTSPYYDVETDSAVRAAKRAKGE